MSKDNKIAGTYEVSPAAGYTGDVAPATAWKILSERKDAVLIDVPHPGGMELCRPARSRVDRQEAGAARMAGLSEHAAQSRVRVGAFGRDRGQGCAAALSVQEWSPIGRGGESHDRGRLQYVSQRGGRLRGSAGRASQARLGGGMEGSGTSVETNLNKIHISDVGQRRSVSVKRVWRGPKWTMRAERSWKRTGRASAIGSARKSATRPSRPGSAKSSSAS